jgi:hypothetical protein
MNTDQISVRAALHAGSVLRLLEDLPDNTGKLIVVDYQNQCQGVLRLRRLLTSRRVRTTDALQALLHCWAAFRFICDIHRGTAMSSYGSRHLLVAYISLNQGKGCEPEESSSPRISWIQQNRPEKWRFVFYA